MYNYVLCSVRLSIIDDPRAENQKLADHHFEVNGSGFFFGTYCFVFRCGAVVMMMMMVTQHIPTMTKSHHGVSNDEGGNVSVSKTHHTPYTMMNYILEYICI